MMRRGVRRTAMFIASLFLVAALWELYKWLGPDKGGEIFGWRVIPRTSDRAMPHTWTMVGRLFDPEVRGTDTLIWQAVLGYSWYTFRMAFVGLVFGGVFGVALAALRRNLEKLGESDRARVITGDATRLPRAAEPFDIVYLDPPYEGDLAVAALASLRAGGWLAPAALIVVECAAKAPLAQPPGFVVEEERRYGAGRIVLLRPIAEPQPATADAVDRSER